MNLLKNWELGDATFWVALDKRKPFPITVYWKSGEWAYDIHTRNLKPQEEILLQGFIRERIHDMESVWNKHTKENIQWRTRTRT